MFLQSLENVALLLLMAVPGFLIVKLKMVPAEGAAKFISVMLIYVCQPFITFNSFLNTDFDRNILINLIAVLIFTGVFTSLMIGIGNLIFLWVKDRDKRGLFSYAGAFGNIGFMCIPFLQILMPDNNEVILYATASIVSFNLVAWTLGNYLITGERKHISLKKAIINPPSLAFLIALPLFLFNLNFNAAPSLAGLAKVCRLFADLVGPLAMIMLGIKIAEMNFKTLFSDPGVYLAAAVKLLLAPVVAFALMMLMTTFMDVAEIRLNLITLAAMPSANNIMMFCTVYDKDAGIAAKCVGISTVLSIVTIPLALMLFV